VSDIRKSRWYQSVTLPRIIGGIFIKLSQIPINNKVIDDLGQYNIKKDTAIRCLNANKHNHVTTTYYLHLKKLERGGELEGSQFEFWDNKKLEKLCIELYGVKAVRGQQRTQAPPPV
jgi:hypothetical protein